jgi:hypothetical protein
MEVHLICDEKRLGISDTYGERPFVLAPKIAAVNRCATQMLQPVGRLKMLILFAAPLRTRGVTSAAETDCEYRANEELDAGDDDTCPTEGVYTPDWVNERYRDFSTIILSRHCQLDGFHWLARFMDAGFCCTPTENCWQVFARVNLPCFVAACRQMNG